MKKTKEELKEEVMEPTTEEPVDTKESFIKPIDYDAEIEHCRRKLSALDDFYRERKSEYEKEIKELQEKRDMEECVKSINNFISRLVEGGLSRDRAEDIASDYIRKNMGLGSKEKKRVSYVDTDCGDFSVVADKIAASFTPWLQ